MFQLAPKGRQRISQDDVVRLAVQSWTAMNGKARLRTVDSLTGGTTRRWSQQNATLVDQVDQRRGRVDRGKMERLHVGPCTSEQRACTVCALGPTTS